MSVYGRDHMRSRVVVCQKSVVQTCSESIMCLTRICKDIYLDSTNLVANHLHLFIPTRFSKGDGFFQLDNASLLHMKHRCYKTDSRNTQLTSKYTSGPHVLQIWAPLSIVNLGKFPAATSNKHDSIMNTSWQYLDIPK